MTRFDEATVNTLRGRLRGPVLLPGGDGFDDAARVWNGMIRARPALIARPTGTADVVECVAFAARERVLIAAKGGGHNIAGTSLADGGLTLDLSRLKGVLVDPERKIARVQAGCLLGDVDRETQLHGLATVLGFVSETGVAGLTLGGGFGYLTRRFGWTVDNLLEVEIVTADGRVLRASPERHEDLFWALRGGGGNFGVVTAFTYRLHEVGPKITGGIIAFPAARFEEVLGTYRELTRMSGRELTMAVTMRNAPPAPFVPKEWHGKPMIGVVVCHTGSRAQADAELAPLRALGDPIADILVEKTYCAQQTLLDATQPKGLNYYWKSEYLPELSDGVIALLRKHAAGVTSPMSQLVLFHLGGALAERGADDGAVGNRDAEHVLGVQAIWPPADSDGARHVAWARTAWEELRPHGTGRLAEVKAKYDPDNLFRCNKNIAPASR